MKWFILNSGEVTGPFNENQIREKLPGLHQPLIWGKHFTEWLTPEQWEIEKTKGPNVEIEQKLRDEEIWKYRCNGREVGPVSYQNLLNDLKRIIDFTDVEVACEGQHDYKDIYSLAQVADDLGISRRAHPRVPLMGTLTIETSNGPFAAKALSVSQGGLGISECPPNFNIGDKIKGSLSSPNLYMNINCLCEIVYTDNHGFTGLRFVNLPTEATSALIEYVNKFKTPTQ